jgi:N-acylneuraminate cytidylyltransferase
MTVAFIPARGGSKRLPGKNLRLFAGRPLISYSIAAALACRRVDRCIVSTDDAEIAEVARQWGAEVIERPAELASDTATTVSAARHVVEQLTSAGAPPDVLITLQPTSPLRPRALVDTALTLFGQHAVDSVISVTESGQKFGLIEEGRFIPRYPVGIRSQDLAPTYFENGLVYVSRACLVFEPGNLFGRRVLPLVVDRIYAMGDIDTALDFDVAEFLFQKYRDCFN